MIVQALAVGLAFAAGLASFASPCVLPLVPAYAAYLSGRTSPADRPRADALLTGAAFVVGLSTVFILLFYVLRQALQPVRPYAVPVAGVAVLLLAANLAGLLRLPVPQRELPADARSAGRRGASGWPPARPGVRDRLDALHRRDPGRGAEHCSSQRDDADRIPADRGLLRRPGRAVLGHRCSWGGHCPRCGPSPGAGA